MSDLIVECEQFASREAVWDYDQAIDWVDLEEKIKL